VVPEADADGDEDARGAVGFAVGGGEGVFGAKAGFKVQLDALDVGDADGGVRGGVDGGKPGGGHGDAAAEEVGVAGVALGARDWG